MVHVGQSYHLKDSFFTLVNDDKLMRNKENGRYRPHYFCFEDNLNPDILWAIPQTTQVEKFREIYNRKVAKYGFCNTILFGSFAGQDNAFLIQNMFPIISKYIDHVHTVNGIPVTLQTSFERTLIKQARSVLALHRRGRNLIFPDIDRIYALMINELNL